MALCAGRTFCFSVRTANGKPKGWSLSKGPRASVSNELANVDARFDSLGLTFLLPPARVNDAPTPSGAAICFRESSGTGAVKQIASGWALFALPGARGHARRLATARSVLPPPKRGALLLSNSTLRFKGAPSVSVPVGAFFVHCSQQYLTWKPAQTHLAVLKSPMATLQRCSEQTRGEFRSECPEQTFATFPTGSCVCHSSC